MGRIKRALKKLKHSLAFRRKKQLSKKSGSYELKTSKGRKLILSHSSMQDYFRKKIRKLKKVKGKHFEIQEPKFFNAKVKGLAVRKSIELPTVEELTEGIITKKTKAFWRHQTIEQKELRKKIIGAFHELKRQAPQDATIDGKHILVKGLNPKTSKIVFIPIHL